MLRSGSKQYEDQTFAYDMLRTGFLEVKASVRMVTGSCQHLVALATRARSARHTGLFPCIQSSGAENCSLCTSPTVCQEITMASRCDRNAGMPQLDVLDAL